MELRRIYKFRLLPRKAQHKRLNAALNQTRDLYNAALEERIAAYEKAGKLVTKFDQMKGLAALRSDPAWAEFASTMQRWPIGKLDLAFRAFFSRVRRGESPGFPRFRAASRFKTFGFNDIGGWAVRDKRFWAKGLGSIRIHMHRKLPSKPISCQVSRDGKGWYLLLVCAVEGEAPVPTGRSIGVDVGLTSFAATSDGALIPNPRILKRVRREQRRRQRQLSRCRRGSRRRCKVKARLEVLLGRVAAARRTFHHQVAARLVRENDFIAVEDLNVKGLSRSFLARDVNDAGWAQFINLLAEKAEKAARTLVKVDPRGTSQTCPQCGTIKVKTLAERTHRCDCGCVLDRDVAAAQVILNRAVAGPGRDNVAGYSERRAGNIAGKRDATLLPFCVGD